MAHEYEHKTSVDRPRVSAELTVQELLDHWPETAQVFIRRGMGCVGCVMAPFNTISHAAAVYHVPVDDLLDELASARRR